MKICTAAKILYAAILTGFLIVAISAFSKMPSAYGQGADTISGQVFHDYNADGFAGPKEHGIQGILIYVYGDENRLLGQPVMTAVDGSYVISDFGAASGLDTSPDTDPTMEEEETLRQVRLEFVIPEDMAYLQPGASGSGSATTVVFATVGESEINVGFSNPANYCQPNPAVITSSFLVGEYNGANGGKAALVSFPYLATGAAMQTVSGTNQDESEQEEANVNLITELAQHNEIGSVYGLAYQRTTGLIYASAFQKRLSGFGPGGPDAIYQLDGSGQVMSIFRLSELIRNGTVGTTSQSNVKGEALFAPRAHNFILNGNELSQRDDLSYGLSGKNALGDLEIADDQQTLYTVNLWNRRIYAIDLSEAVALAQKASNGSQPNESQQDAFAQNQNQDPENGDGRDSVQLVDEDNPQVNLAENLAAALLMPSQPSDEPSGPAIVKEWDVPNACMEAEHRPMGLAWHQGKLWIGSVCEDASVAHIHSLDPVGDQFQLEATIPLDYPREAVLHLDGDMPASAQWQAWSDNPTDFDYAWENGDSSEISLPQPLISDIEFDGPHMVIGLRDRFGDQSGFRALQVPADQATTAKPSDRLYSGDAVGDILRVCWHPSDAHEGDWVLENDISGRCSVDAGDIGPQEESGLGGREYYYWDFYPKRGANEWSPQRDIEHYEITQGGLLQLQSSSWIMTTVMDPFTAFSGGILRLENRTGQRIGIGSNDIASSMAEMEVGGFALYTTASSPARFGHAGGLGDLEALCALAPIELGNRVWHDFNGNGIQDPGEPGLPGVYVNLFEEGLLIGRAKTDGQGTYAFGGIGRTNMFDNAVIAPNGLYQIRIALDEVPLSGRVRVAPQFYGEDDSGRFHSDHESLSNERPPQNPIPETNHAVHDNNGDNNGLAVGFSTAVVQTGPPGTNNHTVDFGFYTDTDLEEPENSSYYNIQSNPNALRDVFRNPVFRNPLYQDPVLPIMPEDEDAGR